MPYKIQKVRLKNCWKVVNANTGVVHTKCGTLENAKKQVRLLNLLDHRSYAHKK